MDQFVFETPRGAGLRPPGRDDLDAIAPHLWCDLILRRCGLTFRQTRLGDVVAAIRDQMRAHGVATEAEFYRLLAKPDAATPEWDALIERLINHETSFFRHPPSFDALRHHILPELRETRGRGGRLNLWSAGCSTGQEAYSLAMVAMADEALKGEFTVWGGDISRYAIEIARRGRYGPRAVATVPDVYRQRFLRSTGAD